MHRQIVFNQQVPLETDLLNTNKYAMQALGWLAQGVLGTGTLVTDVTCIANTPAALNVVVTPGQIFSLQNTDGSAYSSLAADTTHSIIKQGILADPAVLTITPPGTVGFSQNYLIQAIFQETDGGSTTLPYFNPSNPAIAWSGPANSGTPQFTVRQNNLSVTAKAGVAASSGSQTTPAPDAGYVGLFVVTVANGATTISTGNISQLATAPMLGLNGQLPLIPKGVQNQSWTYVVDTGSADALAIAPVPAAAAYVAGQRWSVKKSASANASTTPTINVSGLGAKTIVSASGTALVAGDLPASAFLDLAYDGTNFRAMGGASTSSIINNLHVLAPATRTTYTTPGTYTFTATVAGYHRFWIWGAGGAGGWSASGLAGSGGSAGTFLQKSVSMTVGQTATVVVGAGGASSSSSSNGGAGAASSVTVSGTTYTAPGGPGGISNTTAGSTNSPAIATGPTGGELNLIGGQGGPGYLMTSPTAAGGYGGNAPLGGAGGVGGGGVPNAGAAPGAGGGGTGNGAGASGAGARGEVWVEF